MIGDEHERSAHGALGLGVGAGSEPCEERARHAACSHGGLRAGSILRGAGERGHPDDERPRALLLGLGRKVRASRVGCSERGHGDRQRRERVRPGGDHRRHRPELLCANADPFCVPRRRLGGERAAPQELGHRLERRRRRERDGAVPAVARPCRVERRDRRLQDGLSPAQGAGGDGAVAGAGVASRLEAQGRRGGSAARDRGRWARCARGRGSRRRRASRA